MATNRKPKRKALTKALERKIILEAGGQCPWCQTKVLASEVEIHHIDEDRSNNVPENLLLVCRNHHGQIGARVIPNWEVLLKKQMLSNPGTLERLGLKKKEETPPPIAPIVGRDNSGIAVNQVNIGTVHLRKTSKGRRSITPGLVEANPDMRTYATYLVGKYIEWRMKGASIDKRKFSPGSAHGILAKGYGSPGSVLLIPASKFFKWVGDAQMKIDGTVFGQRNKRNGYPNYHTWEKHLAERGSSVS
jgi:hypothetical protein